MNSSTLTKNHHYLWWRLNDECASTLSDSANYNLDFWNLTSQLILNVNGNHSLNVKLKSCAASFFSTLFPVICLFFFAPLHLFVLKKQSKKFSNKIPFNWYNGARFAAITILVVLNLAQVKSFGLPITLPTVNAFVYALFGVILNFHRLHGLHTSIFAFFFSALLLVVNIPKFCSVLFFETSSSLTSNQLLLFSFQFIALCVLFILTCFADKYTLQHQNERPEMAASFLSQLTLWWANSLFTYGYWNTITENDLWALKPEERAEVVSKRLEINWQQQFTNDAKDNSKVGQKWKKMAAKKDGIEEIKKSDNWRDDFYLLFAVWKVLVCTFGQLYFFQTVTTLCLTLISFAHPQLLKLFFAFIASSSSSFSSNVELKNLLFSKGCLIVSLFFITSSLETLIKEVNSRISNTVISHTSNAFTTLLYQKCLKLDAESRRKTSSGELVSLLDGDSSEMTSVVSVVNQLWTTPLEIAIALYFLWLEVGGAADVVALVIILAMLPLNVWIKRKEKSCRTVYRAKRKERVKLTTELISGIRLLKYFAWEKPFLQKIHTVREEEVSQIAVTNSLGQLLDFIWSVSPFFVSLATFSVYMMLGEDQKSLTAGKVFVSLSLFNLLRKPLQALPRLWTRLAKVAVSTKKVTAFLNSETECYVKKDEDNIYSVKLDSATLAWEKKKESILKEINLKIKKGSLVAVVGSVGAGKSSFLSAILGDMELISGKVVLSTKSSEDSIGYVAQQAWIQNATIRDNILFGEKFQENRYQKILEDCALVEDLRQLPAGDQTEIGEKGINLSGGQKHRVALARACYSTTTPLYLLDDPLAAVDSHVAGHIFKKILSNEEGLLKNKTRILVTSNVAVLPQVDQIVLFEEGRITEMGTNAELLAKPSFAKFVKKKSNIEQLIVSSNVSANDGSKRHTADKNNNNKPSQGKEKTKTEKSSTDGKLIETEKDNSARVSLSVYHSYFLSLTYKAIFLCCCLFAASHLSGTGSRLWLALWSSENGELQNSTIKQKTDLSTLQKGGLSFYGVLGLLSAIFYGVGSISLVRSGLRSASTIHRKLLNHLLRLPMVHYDRTPIGRTINLVSGNLHATDFSLPSMIRGIFMCTVSVLTNLILLSAQMPAFLVVFIPVFVFYCAFESFHRVTDRQLIRLRFRLYSPVYSHFHASHAGMSTIRAFGAQKRFEEECHRRLDAHRRVEYAGFVAQSWMTLRKNLLTDLLSLAIRLMIVSSLRNSVEESSSSSMISPGIIGLLLGQSSSLTTAHYLVAMFGWLDSSMASVERIEECCARKTEDDWEKEEDQNDDDQKWPNKGQIEFFNYSVRYRDGLELVLKEISLKIKGGEKVGIVGRTGAGKSTITLALFRILEASKGRIMIDGLDIAGLGLHRLRRALAIIPQDPTLFSGTIRSNLDPFGVYTDERLLEALKQCHLQKFIDSTDLGLKAVVIENGSNFSVGERQLICAARALLVGAKILVLDEATSAVDPKTDSLIGETIRVAFAHCTVITIAHRLITVLDADRVIVLEGGQVIEFDSPSTLLSNSSSAFYALAKNAAFV